LPHAPPLHSPLGALVTLDAFQLPLLDGLLVTTLESLPRGLPRLGSSESAGRIGPCGCKSRNRSKIEERFNVVLFL
jgi:hypothetical protein